MKKIISLCVCIIMIFSACFVSGITENSLGGKADGKNVKIKTKDEFIELLQSASTAISQIGSETSSPITALTEENGSIISAVEKAKDSFLGSNIPYSGMTIYEKIISKNVQDIDRREEFQQNQSMYGIQYADITTSSEVEGVIYLTDDAVLLTASGKMNYDVVTEEATVKYVQQEYYNVPVRDEIKKASYITDVDTTVTMYMDADNLYFKIDKYHSHTKNRLLTDSEAIENAEESNKESQEQMNLLMGKWIDMKSLGEEMGMPIYSIMAICMGILQKNLEYENEYFTNNSNKTFVEAHNIYSLKQKDFEEYVKGNDIAHGGEFDDLIIIGAADLEDIEGYLTIDLSSAEKPKMVRKISGIYSNEKEGMLCQMNTYCSLSFANIDNTKIVKPKNVLSTEELEELLD